MSIKNLMFWGMDIPKEIESVMKQIEEVDGVESNPYYDNEITAKAWDAGVKYVMDILEAICNADDYHIVIHIPNTEICTEYTYDEFKNLNYVKLCIENNE